MTVRPHGFGVVLGLATSILVVLSGCGAVPTDSAAPGSQQSSSPAATSSRPSPTSRTSAAPTPKASTPAPAPTRKAAPKPAPGPAAVLQKGDTGEKVRELQHRLRQLDWFSGSITGTFGKSTVRGVTGFQERRKLPELGYVDAKTWAKLTGMTRTPTSDERHNRMVPGPAIWRQGSTGDKVRDLQARLKQLNWLSGNVTGTYGTATVAAVKGFQGKRAIPVTGEVDQRTWTRLSGMTRTPTEAEKHNKVAKPSGGGSSAGLDPRCRTGRAMCVSKSSNSLAWVVDGKVQLRVDVRFGSAELPTREGAFRVFRKDRDAVSSIYHTSMPFAMLFSGGQAVHYSPDFAARGYNGASHGCVNVRNYQGIRWLFDEVRLGDKVVVYR